MRQNPTIYYLLDLCCRAMAMQGDKPGRSSASDVLMLVKSAHGF